MICGGICGAPIQIFTGAAQNNGKGREVQAEGGMSDSSGSNGAVGGLSGADVAELSGQIAGLTRAALPLAPSLAALAEELPRGRLRRSMQELSECLESGVSLDQAIEHQRGRIPPHLRGLVIAATRSGRLGEVLGQFSGFVSIGTELKRQLWLSLAYPMLSIVIALALFSFTSVYLVGQFESIFRDFGIPLPLMTIVILEVSRLIRSVWSTVLLLAVALFLFWLTAPLLMRPALLRSMAGKIPIVGGVWRWTSLSEFCHLLALLLENALPLPEALRLTGEGVQDSTIDTVCHRLAPAVESGQTLAEAMAGRRPFPTGLARLVRWAENQGSLPEILHMSAEMFEARARAHASFTGTFLGVAAFILIFFGIFSVIAGLMLPLVTLISRLSG
jgi:type II secretory pathway component PulF